ncbi:acetyltransferase (GNAT) family domain-containing protein [Ditylenchus destructor]|nr:acetyltransferase (GNAT) family domain-containing protein [Ditylenchus destructor]
MNFTLFVVGLTLANIYLVAAQHPGCEVVTTTNCHEDPSVYKADACIVCKNGVEAFGYLYYAKKKKLLGKSKTTLFLKWIFTYYGKQKQGVATALMHFFIETIARANGYKKIKLEVLDGSRNTPAVKTYEKFGFTWVDDENMLRANGYKTIELKLMDGRRNTAAVKTYEKFGFTWVDDENMVLNLFKPFIQRKERILGKQRPDCANVLALAFNSLDDLQENICHHQENIKINEEDLEQS